MVQGEQRDKLGGRVEGLVVRQCIFIVLGVFLVCLDVLAVEMLDHVDVQGNPSSIAVAGPLRILRALAGGEAADHEIYHFPSPLVGFDIIVLI